MGYTAVPTDRCDHCSLVWLDSDDPQNRVLALATNRYLNKRLHETEKETFDLLDIGIHGVAMPTRGAQWLYDDEPGVDARGNAEGQQILGIAQALLRLVLRI